MEGQFDELKSKLPEPWEGKVQFRQNEYMDDNKTPYPMDSRDLLGLVYLMNSDHFPTKSVDKLITRPYSSKASLVNMFATDEQRNKFNVTKSKLNDILKSIKGLPVSLYINGLFTFLYPIIFLEIFQAL